MKQLTATQIESTLQASGHGYGSSTNAKVVRKLTDEYSEGIRNTIDTQNAHTRSKYDHPAVSNRLMCNININKMVAKMQDCTGAVYKPSVGRCHSTKMAFNFRWIVHCNSGIGGCRFCHRLVRGLVSLLKCNYYFHFVFQLESRPTFLSILISTFQ